MADAQSYANHRHRPTAWLVAWSGAVAVTIALAVAAYRRPALDTLAAALLGLIVIVAISLLRTFALTLQNRIIRLEMQVRLARLGRDADLVRLTLPQTIALRFASDAELPVLVDRAITERLSADQIKRAVTDWQPDFLRT